MSRTRPSKFVTCDKSGKYQYVKSSTKTPTALGRCPSEYNIGDTAKGLDGKTYAIQQFSRSLRKGPKRGETIKYNRWVLTKSLKKLDSDLKAYLIELLKNNYPQFKDDVIRLNDVRKILKYNMQQMVKLYNADSKLDGLKSWVMAAKTSEQKIKENFNSMDWSGIEGFGDDVGKDGLTDEDMTDALYGLLGKDNFNYFNNILIEMFKHIKNMEGVDERALKELEGILSKLITTGKPNDGFEPYSNLTSSNSGLNDEDMGDALYGLLGKDNFNYFNDIVKNLAKFEESKIALHEELQKLKDYNQIGGVLSNFFGKTSDLTKLNVDDIKNTMNNINKKIKETTDAAENNLKSLTKQLETNQEKLSSEIDLKNESIENLQSKIKEANKSIVALRANNTELTDILSKERKAEMKKNHCKFGSFTFNIPSVSRSITYNSDNDCTDTFKKTIREKYKTYCFNSDNKKWLNGSYEPTNLNLGSILVGTEYKCALQKIYIHLSARAISKLQSASGKLKSKGVDLDTDVFTGWFIQNTKDILKYNFKDISDKKKNIFKDIFKGNMENAFNFATSPDYGGGAFAIFVVKNTCTSNKCKQLKEGFRRAQILELYKKSLNINTNAEKQNLKNTYTNLITYVPVIPGNTTSKYNYLLEGTGKIIDDKKITAASHPKPPGKSNASVQQPSSTASHLKSSDKPNASVQQPSATAPHPNASAQQTQSSANAASLSKSSNKSYAKVVSRTTPQQKTTQTTTSTQQKVVQPSSGVSALSFAAKKLTSPNSNATTTATSTTASKWGTLGWPSEPTTEKQKTNCNKPCASIKGNIMDGTCGSLCAKTWIDYINKNHSNLPFNANEKYALNTSGTGDISWKKGVFKDRSDLHAAAIKHFKNPGVKNLNNLGAAFKKGMFAKSIRNATK